MKSIISFGFLTIVAALIIAISCQKAATGDLTTTPPPTGGGGEQKEFVIASIAGRILDDNKQPVSGALVKAGSLTATSDIDGKFRITNVSLDKHAGLIKVEKDGFFQGSRTIIVNANAVNNVSIELIKKKVSGTVSGSTGGNITVQGGGNIVFGGNSFVNTAGNAAYTGTVSVSTFFLNPTAPNFNEIMPGALRGITAANEETGLQSFGMMAVELTGAGGEKLQLATGKTATLTFPIPAELLKDAPLTIPLWSFNDTTGLWKEEGTATKLGNNYVGTVTHFSFWNCDYPYGVVNFNAIVKDQNGNIFANGRVVISVTTDKYTTYGSGITDSTGWVGGLIPKGKVLQLTIYNKCNTVVLTKDIGPFSSNADLGTLTVSNPATGSVTISGTVTNCSLAPVTNGFVDIYLDSMHTHAVVTNGSFNITISRCSSGPATATVQAYDLGGNQSGTASSLQINSATVNAGSLSACGTTLTEFLNYTLNSVSKSYIVPADSVFSSKNGSSYTIYAFRKGSGSGDQVYLNFSATATGSVPLGSIYIAESNKYWFPQSSITLNLTEFTAGSGGYMAGNFTGTLTDSIATAPVSMSFRVKKQ
ncbi:carboxypeptidase-like regulatory domain-containing protein [Niastella sp. OAS944]|uniref:carboxypeptidase-like regulatory domain-containing protein n=1 Tax=Niastella sp. OAS944 TaxID=2664089 RepID=UPI0034905F3B|nr:hypothetical protein [Chitinophagaceae bacterium OAS944]